MTDKEAFEIVLEMARKANTFAAKEVEALEIAKDYMERWNAEVEYARYNNERPPSRYE